MNLFIIQLSYHKSLAEVDALIPQHNMFLDKYYAAGTFLVSGRQEPRIGGIILAGAGSRSEIEDLVKEDPFYINGIATYEITEFIPGRYADVFALVMDVLNE